MVLSGATERQTDRGSDAYEMRVARLLRGLLSVDFA
jgi:hypothetical protein